MLFAQYVRQAPANVGDKRCAFCRRLHTELGIVPRHVDLLQITVRAGHIGYARFGQLLRQPALVGSERSL